MKKSRKVIIVVVLIIAVLGVAQIVIKAKTAAGNNSQTVRIEKPRRGELIEFVSAPGEIEPKTKVALSAKVTSRITELPYEEGDKVTKGDPSANPPVPASVLVRLDSKDLESQLRSVKASRDGQAAQLEVEKARIEGQRANLIGLEASFKQAQRDLERQKDLLSSQDISQTIYEQAKLKADELKSQYESSQHSLKAAELGLVVLEHNLEASEARVAEAEEALTYTTITSPIDGVVTRVNAEVGEMVVFGTMNNPGTVIIEVADLSKMLVVAQVDEADVAKVQAGQNAKVQVDAFPDCEFMGVISSVALSHTASSSGTKYFRTEILLNASNEKLYSGLTAHVDIETVRHTDVLKVPSQAVMGRNIDELPLEIRDNNPYIDKEKTFAAVVFRFANGKALVTPVKMGTSDLTHTIIEAGITEDDKIVVGPYKVLDVLKHDQKIKDEKEVESKKKQAMKNADANSN
ncbi:MAG: efflux RND transporter periplasmic adaptor subunit [Sedimentisphaerales bacterium]|nr:efflux RND transporter periplasmic adaptor subunit [Sedimentisphaerales bacterium]